MPYFVGLDASKQRVSICVMDKSGAVLREGEVESTPRAIVEYLRGDRLRYVRVGIESANLASWLYEGLKKAGLPVVCIEARHAHGVLKAQPNKTDRSDARGIADLMRTGVYRIVHVKCRSSREIQSILTARKILRIKAVDLQNAIRGLLLGLGLKLDSKKRMTFEQRVLTLACKDPFASELVKPLLEIQVTIAEQVAAYDARLRSLAGADPVCRLLMTAPGVGTLTAIRFRTAVDEPHRFRTSRSVGAHFGLVPRTYQSGEMERRGGISKRGDQDVRSALYMAALGVFRTKASACDLKTWGEAVAARRGRKRGVVAVARRLAVMLHRMWITGSTYRWEKAAA